jgi:peptidyl-tRNA hydrolase
LTNAFDHILGSSAAQGSHSSVAAIAKALQEKDADTVEYLEQLQSMRKVVLKAEDADQLTRLQAELTTQNVPHHLWIEQPENVPTCLVTYPRDKNTIAHLFKRFRLFK